jgi:site-specific DNA-methyltransferase (adenine-specific)
VSNELGLLLLNSVIQGDCLEVMRSLPDNSVDSIVTDPPAGIAFMGKAWDSNKGGRKQWCAYMEERFAEALRICKPGGHALVWALPRTSHWTATALEDAGWEVRDICVHLFGGGFPKSMAIDKAIDKAAGVEREVVGSGKGRTGTAAAPHGSSFSDDNYQWPGNFNITAPATPEAKQWEGFGTALKPAHENWILCRKPIKGTISGNVLEWGVGGIHVDACRVGEGDSETARVRNNTKAIFGSAGGPNLGGQQGRFPPNLLLSHTPTCNGSGCADACPIRVLDEQTGILKVGGNVPTGANRNTGKFGVLPLPQVG